MPGCELASQSWMRATSPKATSLIASGEFGRIHMAACSAVSRDYVFDSPDLWNKRNIGADAEVTHDGIPVARDVALICSTA